MGYKNDDRCLDAAGDDEPIFVLRANDELAPLIVDMWVELSRSKGMHLGKLDEATAHAARMRQWKAEQGERDSAVPS